MQTTIINPKYVVLVTGYCKRLTAKNIKHIKKELRTNGLADKCILEFTSQRRVSNDISKSEKRNIKELLEKMECENYLVFSGTHCTRNISDIMDSIFDVYCPNLVLMENMYEMKYVTCENTSMLIYYFTTEKRYK